MGAPTGDDERAAFLSGDDERATFLRRTPREERRRSGHYCWTTALGTVAVAFVFLIGTAVYFASNSGGGGGRGFLPPRAVASVVQQVSNATAPPLAQPWWITHHIAPAGPERDMGSWTAVTFSEEQQGQFGVDENGTVTDKARFARAVSELERGAGGNSATAAVPPWWVTFHVEPAGKDRTMGSWTAVTFSEEQQDLFGVDQDGVVTNAATFAAARAANFLGEGRAVGSGEEEDNREEEDEHCGGGPPESMACTLIVVFGEPATDGDIQQFASQHIKSAQYQVLRSLKQVILRYEDDVRRCCSAYNKSWAAKGVVSVEFDQVAHTLDPSGGAISIGGGAASAGVEGPVAASGEGEERGEEEDNYCGGGPPENMACTLIVVFGEPATDGDIQQFASQHNESAQYQVLRSLKQVILRYEDDVHRCCSAYNKSWAAKGVVSVEFDQVAHTLDPSGGAISIGGGVGSVGVEGPPAASGEGEDCAGRLSDGMGCTLIVVFQEGTAAADIQQFADGHNESASAYVLRSLKQVILRYEDDVDRCCSAYKESWKARGVVSVELDQAVYALGPKVGAGNARRGIMSIS